MTVVPFPAHLSTGVILRLVDELDVTDDRHWKPVFARHTAELTLTALKAGVPDAVVVAEVDRVIKAGIATVILRRAERVERANREEEAT